MSPFVPESQADRTRLSWRRTLNGFLAVAGIGGLRMVANGHILETVLGCGTALAASIPMYIRQIQLRSGHRPAVWAPMAVAFGTSAFAIAVLVTP